MPHLVDKIFLEVALVDAQHGEHGVWRMTVQGTLQITKKKGKQPPLPSLFPFTPHLVEEYVLLKGSFLGVQHAERGTRRICGGDRGHHNGLAAQLVRNQLAHVSDLASAKAARGPHNTGWARGGCGGELELPACPHNIYLASGCMD